jgi:hypothetical protein
VLGRRLRIVFKMSPVRTPGYRDDGNAHIRLVNGQPHSAFSPRNRGRGKVRVEVNNVVPLDVRTD